MLGNWITDNAGRTPGKAALRYQGRAISYAELAALIDTLAKALAASGVRKGDCVAFLGLNSPDMLALLFSCAKLGALFMPLNWRLAAPEHGRCSKTAHPMS